MALNIAVPMSGVGDLLEGFGLLSPISPVSIDFRSSIKNPLSPVGSESSGVSSLDLEDIKKQMPTLMDEHEESEGSSGPGKSPSNTTVGSTTISSAASSRTCSTSSSSSTASDDYANQMDEQKSSDGSTSNDDEDGAAAVAVAAAPPSLTSPDLLGSNATEVEKEPAAVTGSDGSSAYAEEAKRSLELALSKELNELPLLSSKTLEEPIFSEPRTSIYYNNRDILDLASNIRPQGTPGEFAFQFAELPETNNIQFFLQNRSQYHRLGPNGHVQEFRMATCACCDFQYPVNTVGANSYAATAAPSAANQGFGTANLANLNANQIYGNLQQQQQQQQHQQQMRLQQQQLQMQYANRYNGNANGNSMGRDYNMYHQQAAASGLGGASNGAGGNLQSSRFNNGAYGSANVLPGGGSLQNAHNILGSSSAANGGFFNNSLLQSREQYNAMASRMGMQYNNGGTAPKGISQSNGTLSQQTEQLRQQQQQYDIYQQQKQFLNSYAGLGTAAGNSGVNVTAPSNAAAVRLQQQSQQASYYYKKPQTVRYGGAGVNNTMPSSAGPSTGSNWKSPMANNNTLQDPTTKQLFMELNKMQQQQQQQQQQQSQYYVPFQ